MKEILQRIWMPVIGGASSIGFKKISESELSQQLIDSATEITTNAPSDKTLFQYFLIGVVGAAGGLALKIAWSCIK